MCKTHGILSSRDMQKFSKHVHLHSIHHCHEAEQEFCVDFFIFDKPVNEKKLNDTAADILH